MNMRPKDEFLKRLFEAKGEPISGQQFAEEYGLSRTAIWKYVKEFEEEGYEIGTIRKKGYYLIASPDLINATNIKKHLQTEAYGKTIHYEKCCDSTQHIAHRLAQNEAKDGMIVISEEQTAGKGRMARQWSSAAYKGIWMSVILRPNLTPQQAPQITLVAAVAIVRAIEELTGLTVQIKWPNDLLIQGKKVVGILTELQADPDRIKAIILGIGINVNQNKEDFPKELQSIATSLKLQSNEKINRAQLIAKTLQYLEQYIHLYESEGFRPLKILWESYSLTFGKKVKAVLPRETIEGTAIGMTDEGMLQLQLADGTIRTIFSGDIEFT